MIQKKWCLQDIALPLVPRTLDFMDFDNIVNEDDATDCQFLVLSIKATADVKWLTTYLEKPSRWWLLSGRSQPLVSEIIQAMPASRTNKGFCTSKTVVAIQVRGQKFLVPNNRASPAFVFHEADPNFEVLEWFLKELHKDLTNGIPKVRHVAPRLPAGPREEQDIVEEVLHTLLDHDNCKNAWFLSSLNSLKVQRASDKISKVFGVKGLNKKRKGVLERSDPQSVESLRSLYIEASQQCLVFLQEQPKPTEAASSSSARVPLAVNANQEGEAEEHQSEDDE